MNLKKIMSGAAAFMMTASLMTSYPTGCFKGLVVPVTSEAARELPSGYDEYVTWKFTDSSTVVISPKENCENPIITKNLIDTIDNVATLNNYIENYKVIIENGISNIGDSAFWDNRNLLNISLPQTLVSIGKNAFADCIELLEIDIPETVTFIGEKAISNCSKITTVSIPSKAINTKNILYNCGNLKSVYIKCCGDKNIDLNWFKSNNNFNANCFALHSHTTNPCVCDICGEEVHNTASNGVCNNCGYKFGSCGPNATYTLDSQGNLVISGSGDINESAFKGNESIKNVIIGDEITVIRKEAFSGCVNIICVTIGEKVNTIVKWAFKDCKKLENITIPNSVSSVNDDILFNCSNLGSITAPCGIKKTLSLSEHKDKINYTHAELDANCVCTKCKEPLHTYTTDPHKCDKCEDTSVHTDADKNSNCDICGKDIVRIKVAPADEKIYAFGDSVTITAPTAETGMTFDCWLNSQNVAVSNESPYTFTATVNDTFTPKYKSAKAETMTVVWLSAYGQEMGRKEIDSSQFNIETLKTEVSVPSRLGYEDGVWTLQTDSVSEFTNGAVMTFVPEYKKSEEKFAITSIIDGVTETKSYLQTEIARVTAPEINSNGQKFSCWKDENGNILSYSTTYGFYVAKSLTLTAVYNEVVEEKGTANLVSVNYADSKITVVSQLTIPNSNYKMLFAGLVATKDATIGTNVNKDNAKYVRGGENLPYTSYRYTWNLKTTSSADWYIKPYLAYQKPNGTVEYMYGDCIVYNPLS